MTDSNIIPFKKNNPEVIEENLYALFESLEGALVIHFKKGRLTKSELYSNRMSLSVTDTHNINNLICEEALHATKS